MVSLSIDTRAYAATLRRRGGSGSAGFIFRMIRANINPSLRLSVL